MVVEESLVEESVIFVRVAAIARRVSRSHCAPSAVLEAASRRSRRRRVAFTTRSLRGVRSREGQGTVEAETFAGELFEDFMHLRRVVFDGAPEIEGK